MKVTIRRMTAFCLVMAFVLCVWPLTAQSSNDKPARTISVSGTAKVSVEIEYVQLAFSVVTRDKSFEKAQTDNMQVVDLVLKELAGKFAVKGADVYTDNIKLIEYYEENLQGVRKRAGYESRTSVTVKLRDLTKYRDMLVSLIKLGANGIDSVNYIPKELGPYKIAAIKQAFLMAQSKAQTLASAAGTKILAVISIHEQSSYDGGPSPIVQSNAYYRQSSSEAGSSDGISIGERTLSAEVSVVFEIQ